MSGFTAGYRSRLITHEELIARLRPGNVITLGTWMGQPHGVTRALGQLGPEIDPLYVSASPASGPGDYLNQPHVRCLSTFLGPHERAARRERQHVSFTPLQYTDAFKSVRTNRPPDYLIVRTAPMDERGCFNLSLACSWENDAIRWYRDHAPSTQIVVEVNPRMPRVCGLPALGNNEVSLADVSLIVEDDTPLPDFTTPEPTAGRPPDCRQCRRRWWTTGRRSSSASARSPWSSAGSWPTGKSWESTPSCSASRTST